MKENDWLNTFVEKNMWGIIFALIAAVISYTALSGKVNAQEARIYDIEQTQIVIIENQKSIIELQTNQANIKKDIDEIKKDVKELLKRQ